MIALVRDALAAIAVVVIITLLGIANRAHSRVNA